MKTSLSLSLLLSILVLNGCGAAPIKPQTTLVDKTYSSTNKDSQPSTVGSGNTVATKPSPVSTPAVLEGNNPVETQTETTPVTPMNPVVSAPGAMNPAVAVGKISDLKVLVFSKTGGFRHGDSIEEGIKAMKALSAKHGFMMEATEDATAISKANLAKFNVVFFLNTTGEILNDDQKKDFQEYMENGGGYVGTHSASDTLYNWPFYENIVGAWFGGHGGIEQAKVKVENKTHPTTSFLTDIWMRADEWYNYRKNPRMNVTVLMTLDETSYAGGRSNNDHPITWCKDVGKGRSWYTGFGHTRETFTDPKMLRMILNAQLWAAKINATVPD